MKERKERDLEYKDKEHKTTRFQTENDKNNASRATMVREKQKINGIKRKNKYHEIPVNKQQDGSYTPNY